MQNRRPFGGGFLGVEHMGQNLICHVDQFQRLFGDLFRCGGHGGDRVAIKKCFAPRHAGGADVGEHT